MAERMGRFLSALHSANQPKVKVGDKIETIRGGQVPGTVEKVKDNGSVSFRHPNGKLYRTHHTNVRVVKEDTDSEGDTMQVDENWASLNVRLGTGKSIEDHKRNLQAAGISFRQSRSPYENHVAFKVPIKHERKAKKILWREEVEQIDETSKAARVANKLIDKKRRSLVNLKPQTDSIPMNGNLMTQAPTSDASAPTPGIK